MKKSYSQELLACRDEDLAKTLKAENTALLERNGKLNKALTEWSAKTDKLYFELDRLVEQNATLRHEFKMAQASMPEVKKLKAENTRLAAELKDRESNIRELEAAAEYWMNDGDKSDERIVKLREALKNISNFFVTVDNGRFGAFVGAGAVDIAIEALAADDEMESKK